MFVVVCFDCFFVFCLCVFLLAGKLKLSGVRIYFRSLVAMNLRKAAGIAPLPSSACVCVFVFYMFIMLYVLFVCSLNTRTFLSSNAERCTLHLILLNLACESAVPLPLLFLHSSNLLLLLFVCLFVCLFILFVCLFPFVSFH